MKNTSKKHSAKASNKKKASPPSKLEKSSIIVLSIAAVIFLIALFSIYSKGISEDTGDLFSPYGEQIVEFEKATVNEILSEDYKPDDAADGAYAGQQKLSVTVKSGRYKGESMIAYNFFGPLSGVPVSVGNSVTLTIKIQDTGEHSATVYEFNRIPILAAFLILFFIVTIIVGGRTGLKSLFGLVFTILCLFTILIPLLLKGAPTILTTFIMCAYVSLVCFTILGGVHRKTISAFLGTVSGAFIATIFGLAGQYFGKIDGLRLEDAEPLFQLKYYTDNISLNLRGLLVASIIICALFSIVYRCLCLFAW